MWCFSLAQLFSYISQIHVLICLVVHCNLHKRKETNKFQIMGWLTNCFFFIQVAFEDILAEPDGAHSIDCVWLNSYMCFNCAKNICYSLMTTLCGLFIALFWGCGFACITFKQVWCITPCLRCCSIEMGCAQKLYGTCINCYMAPVYENIGLMFSRITIKKLWWKAVL